MGYFGRYFGVTLPPPPSYTVSISPAAIVGQTVAITFTPTTTPDAPININVARTGPGIEGGDDGLIDSVVLPTTGQPQSVSTSFSQTGTFTVTSTTAQAGIIDPPPATIAVLDLSPTYNITPACVNNAGPVLPNGDVILVRGDAYAAVDGRSLSWSSTTWPVLTGATVSFAVSDLAGGTTYIDPTPGTIVDATTVTVDLTTAQTSLLPLNALTGKGQFRFSIEAVLASGHTATLLIGRLAAIQP